MLSFKPEIQDRLRKKSLNKASNILHNHNKFSLYIWHQTTQ